MASDTLKDVPEFFEVELGESLLSRTDTLASFRELGPPDLCHIIKTTGRSGVRDIGSYHYVSGVDASSSASLAAYINSLTYNVEETTSWFGGKKGEYKVRSGCFCCFNAFSRVDLRVEVRIPGGVEAYILDSRGNRHDPTPTLWSEVYLSSLLRSILYADDASYHLVGFRKLDPIRTADDEERFIKVAEELFGRAWQLGSDPEIQVATGVTNHLTKGLVKYFGECFRWGPAVNLFEKLATRDGEVACLLAQSYLGMNEEVQAVRVLHEALQGHPQSYALLHVQSDFLRSKGKHDWALQLAKHAVNAAPSEFVTWAKLTEVCIELGQFHEALLTLNSCPMFTYNERDLHRMPSPAKTSVPIKRFVADSGLLDEDLRSNEADVILLRLPAPALRGTFAKAYALLTRLVFQIGWDELLKCRSHVFVMEEEYRMQKTAEPGPGRTGNVNGRGGSTGGEGEGDGADPNASTTALRPTDDVNGAGAGGEEPRPDEGHHSPIPTIKISTSESDSDVDHLATPAVDASKAHGDEADAVATAAAAEVDVNAPDGTGEGRSSLDGPAPGLEKPQHAVAGDVAEEVAGQEAKDGEGKKLSFSSKRLCERWLDNLFMVLYEDLRVYTIWRSEVTQHKGHHAAYNKTGTEWEILGDLALRLHRKEEAKDAYQRCVEEKFSAKAWLKLLEFWTDENDLDRALKAAVRLAVHQHRWYMECSYPSAVGHHLFRLIQREGVSKVSFSLVAMHLPAPVLKNCMQPYFDWATQFRVEGSDF